VATRPSAQERAALARYGTISSGTRMQAMATGADAVAAPIELKAVDANWPLVGRLTLADGRTVGAPGAGGPISPTEPPNASASTSASRSTSQGKS
jgi:predicted lysophospholipase L1 biosynthesis ABC-type transport system permease subunit